MSEFPPELREKIAQVFDGVTSNVPGPDYWVADRVWETIKDDIILKRDLADYLKDILCDYGAAATNSVAGIVDLLVSKAIECDDRWEPDEGPIADS